MHYYLIHAKTRPILVRMIEEAQKNGDRIVGSIIVDYFKTGEGNIPDNNFIQVMKTTAWSPIAFTGPISKIEKENQ